MSNTQKTLATVLVALLAAAATPVASLALTSGRNGVHPACQGGGAGCGA
jgi:hypothetical protein